MKYVCVYNIYIMCVFINIVIVLEFASTTVYNTRWSLLKVRLLISAYYKLTVPAGQPWASPGPAYSMIKGHRISCIYN